MNYALNEDKMFADVTDGIAIIINSETGIYYGLNASATSIYENLMQGVSVDGIIEKLKKIQGVPSDIEKRVNDFISDMLKFELIIETNSSNAEASFDENILKEDNFELSLKDYNDAQELLLADPIHEVKDEIGWSGEKDSIIEDKELVAQREARTE